MNEPKTEHTDGEEKLCCLADFIPGGQYKGNPLLPDVVRLLKMYRRLKQRAAKLATEHEQLKLELVNIVRSLNLAGRIDGMTGLANRRDIVERIEREASRANRHQRVFCTLLLNIDDFRQVNNSYGYNAGDDVLVEIARMLKGSVRSEDICARWGGDEFLMLLPETHREGAEAVAAKLLEAIAMTEFKAQKPGIRIAASIGIMEYCPSRSVHECVSSAEQALLQAKRDGKNRYVIGG